MTTASILVPSLDPSELFDALDLHLPELASVRAEMEAGDRFAALTALRAHYRHRFRAGISVPPTDDTCIADAEDVVRRIFTSSTHGRRQYPQPMDWAKGPEGSVSDAIVLARFGWARSLAQAYSLAPDRRYVTTFIELVDDCFSKYPLGESDPTVPTVQDARRWIWSDLQVSRRARHLLEATEAMIHDEAFDPAFFGRLLAIMYDHQRVAMERPKPQQAHNMAMAEQDALSQLAEAFSEFRQSRAWMRTAMQRMFDSIVRQTTEDGVQFEWAAGYHISVLNGASSVMARAKSLGMAIPDEISKRIRLMADYLTAMLSPDHNLPAFSDFKRPVKGPLSPWPVVPTFDRIAALFDEPRYSAIIRGDATAMPTQRCHAFHHAGMYALRDRWGPDGTTLILHNPPVWGTFHDEPDNGTFELCVRGRWLMNDTGYFTYGEDTAKRGWHRQTRVHQTLTLNGADAQIKGRTLLWQPDDACKVLIVENDSYESLTHRRSIWYVDNRFFVLVDEARTPTAKEEHGGLSPHARASGDAMGDIDLHFQLAPPEVPTGTGAATEHVIDCVGHRAYTRFNDVNLLVWQSPSAPVTMEVEEGWYAHEYNARVPRPAFRYRHHSRQTPATFLTLLVPFEGRAVPQVNATMDDHAIHVTIDGKTCTISRPAKL